jgi:thioredoxin-like negative regulator of GroEL
MTNEVKVLGSTNEYKSYFAEIDENQITVIKIGATWCGSCRSFDPKFKELSENGSAQFLEVDADACPRVTMEHDIRSVPVVLIFKGKNRKVKVTNPAQNLTLINSEIDRLTKEN